MEVMCPACSGSGFGGGRKPAPGVHTLPCRLCRGAGEIDDEKVEEFWTCIQASSASGMATSQPLRCAGDVGGWHQWP